MRRCFVLFFFFFFFFFSNYINVRVLVVEKSELTIRENQELEANNEKWK